MGYDMYCEGSHPAIVEQRHIARSIRYIRDGDNTEWNTEHDKLWKMEAKERAYFRLNVWGMGKYRTQMEELGMLDWPEFSPDVDADTGGVLPGYKFCSNDGWLVSPTEIKNSLEVWDTKLTDELAVGGAIEDLLDGEDSEYWVQWIKFLQHTADHGGFRVW